MILFNLIYLLASCSWWSKSQSFLNILSDGHGAEYVEEDEATVSHVITQQVPVTQTLDPVDGGEGELGNNTTIKDGVEHWEESSECKSYKFWLFIHIQVFTDLSTFKADSIQLLHQVALALIHNN